MPTIYANRGKSLESVIVASQRNVIRVERMSAGVKWIGKGKFIPCKGPVDFQGTVCGSGKSICFDAKKCGNKGGFPIGNTTHFPRHQREYLTRQGMAGAIAGLLIEATHPSEGRFYWLPWHYCDAGFTSLNWELLDDLGDNKHLIQFERIPGIEVEAA